MNLIRLQRVQNRAARLVTRTKTQDHITPVLRDLHWLPVSSRIDFKLCLYMYKALKKTVPIYITNVLVFNTFIIIFNDCYLCLIN